MKKDQELTYEQKQLKELADRLEARMHTTTVLAEIVLDNDAMRGGEPGPYLNEYRAGALMDAVIHLSRANFDDFCRLADLAGVPK